MAVLWWGGNGSRKNGVACGARNGAMTLEFCNPRQFQGSYSTTLSHCILKRKLKCLLKLKSYSAGQIG